MHKIAVGGVIGFAVATFFGAAVAHEYRRGDLAIDHPWAGATAPAAKTGAAYMTVVNNGNSDERLIAARSSIAPTVELHRSETVDGIVRMRRQENGVVIPAGATVEFRPGSYHIMMIGLSAPMRLGQEVPLTLVFEKAGEVTVDLRVEAPRAGSGGHGATH